MNTKAIKRIKFWHEKQANRFANNQIFEGCQFNSINLIDIKSMGQNCQFINCKFRNCYIDETFFLNSNFSNCQFINCQFEGFSFEATFCNCTFREIMILQGVYLTIIEFDDIIRIGCQNNKLGVWNRFFSDQSVEELETPRNSPKFDLIKQDFKEAIEIYNKLTN